MPPRAALQLLRAVRDLAPGVAFCGLLTLTAGLLAQAEVRCLGRAWLEPVALAIVLGVVVRTLGRPNARIAGGVTFAAKTILEVAVVLLGATVSLAALGARGPTLLAGVIGAVIASVFVSYAIGRLLGLPRNLATLVACGSSICGNSAIAAVAPVIDADSSDVAASVAFTAVFSIVVVVGLPYLAPLLHLKAFPYGVLAGLTVYAVPQVVAATAPLGIVAMQTGALVKLTRVLMLGPIIAGVSVLSRIFPEPSTSSEHASTSARRIFRQALPSFVLGFIAMASARSGGLISDQLSLWAGQLSTILTCLAMAALGLMVDLRVVLQTSSRVTTTAALSILVIGALGLCLIEALHLNL